MVDPRTRRRGSDDVRFHPPETDHAWPRPCIGWGRRSAERMTVGRKQRMPSPSDELQATSDRLSARTEALNARTAALRSSSERLRVATQRLREKTEAMQRAADERAKTSSAPPP